MRLPYVPVFLAVIASGVVLARPALAQTFTTGAAFSLPSASHTFEADSQGSCPVGFDTTGYHYVVFVGPINGNVTWSGSIAAFIGQGPVFDGTLKINGHPSDSHTLMMTLPANETIQKNLSCYGTALYSAARGTSPYTGTGKAYVSYQLPGQSAVSGTPGPVTFTIAPYSGP